jgi:hypothetical protein
VSRSELRDAVDLEGERANARLLESLRGRTVSALA